jgi:HD superfamily phosphohydrolase
LDRFPAFHERYDEQDYLALILAGLLHDLGHYPCSHQLDHIRPFPEHEHLTIGVIKGDIRINGEDLGAFIRETFDLDPERITELLGPVSGVAPHRMLLKQVIDSPLDADKCDYLPRDSYYCGLDYGGIDRDRFIANLVPSEDGQRLGVGEKGLMSAERLQLARYWMYRTVYWGHTVRGLIRMLSTACEYMHPVEDEQAWIARLMTFNDHSFLDWLHGQVEKPGKELIEMVHHRRELYKRLYTVSQHHQPENYRMLQVDPDLRNEILNWFHQWSRKKGLVLERHHLIWDVPPVYKSRSWERFPIVLAHGEEVSIVRESPVIDALSKAFLYGVRKIRLFCHPRLAALVKEHKPEIPPIHEFGGLFPPEIM